jgi:hypothetical protein
LEIGSNTIAAKITNSKNPYQIYGLGFVKLSSLNVSIYFYSFNTKHGSGGGGMPRFIRGGWLVPAHTTPAHLKDPKPAARIKRNLHAK